jgi:nucleotide-binding universal stress UspA family protein
VLVVRSALAFPPARVEIPVDLSPVAAHGLRRGLDLLAAVGVPPGAVEVLFVLHPLETGGSVQFSPEQVQRFAADELRRFLAANTAPGARPLTAQVRTGFPRQEILATLEEREVDLVVLGTHGRSGFDRLVLGSIAAGVLRGAGCNVLLVPPGGEEAEEAPPRGADWEYVADAEPATAPAGKGERR